MVLTCCCQSLLVFLYYDNETYRKGIGTNDGTQKELPVQHKKAHFLITSVCADDYFVEFTFEYNNRTMRIAGRSSDFGIILALYFFCAFPLLSSGFWGKERVIHYSGATVPDLHGIPYSLLPFGRGQKHHTITDAANIRYFLK